MFTCQKTNIIPVVSGSVYEDTVVINNPDGSLFDLTGCSVTGQIRNINDELIGNFLCSVAIPSSGQVDRILSDSITILLKTTSVYVWGLKITDADGYVYPEIQGGITLTQGVVHV